MLTTARRPTRTRRIVLLAGATVLFGVAVPVGYYLIRDHNAEIALQDAIAEADRLDPGWRLDELEANRAAVEPQKNSAVLLTRLGPTHMAILNKGTVRQDLNTVTSEIFEIADPRVPLTQKQRKALRAALQPLAPIVTEARTIAAMPNGRFAPNVRAQLNWTIPNADRVGSTFWLLQSDAELRNADVNAEGAWLSCQAMINAARALGDEPLQMIQVVRGSRVGQAIGLLEKTLALGVVPEPQLAATQELLRDELQHPGLLLALRSNRAMAHHCFALLESGRASLSEAKRLAAGNFGPGDMVEQAQGFLGRHEIRPAHAWLLHFTNQAVEIGIRPEPEVMPALKKLEESVADAPSLARMLAPKLKNLELLVTNRARVRSAMAGLAVERFRVRNGRWPAALEEVVAAQLLAEVPLDPFDGRPLRWRVTPDGVVVYSIGRTGHGDGCLLDGDAPAPTAERVEFRLWNVDQRRRERKD